MNLNFNESQYSEVAFKKGKVTCPICLRTHHYFCSVTIDDGLCLCSYVSSEKVTRDGRYIHILKTNSVESNRQLVKLAESNKSNNPIADVERLNAVYTAFLKSLALLPEHSEKLLNERGLSDATIIKNLYVSVPSYDQRFEVAQTLAESFDLQGVPGFYFENGKWTLHLTFPGFYVPFKDEFGRIAGMQIRKDNYEKNDKYIWLSSYKKGGTKPDNPLHFVNPDLIKSQKVIYVTEGALKADIVGDLQEIGLVAIAGVTAMNPQKLIERVKVAFPDLEKAVLAFDMDWQEKEEVKGALFRLLSALKDSFPTVEVITWERELGKGLDDALINLKNQELLNDSINIESYFKYIKAEEALPEILSNSKTEEEKVRNENIETFGISCRDFLEMDFPNPEKVMFGLGRGNLGLMIASTNIGKTTLALNLSLSAGRNKPFSPLFDENHKARKVMYIDGEATKADLQADIKKMLERCFPKEQELIKDNLCFICDEELSDEPLDLINPEHLRAVTEKAREFNPDLIIIDTLSALMTMEDENDNAKVKKEVIQPLKTLAKKANAGVLLLHHSGKFIEGSPQAEDAYKGRGASAFGALSRVIFNLKPVKNSNKITLSCAKVKSGKFSPVAMELDENTRWFKVLNDVPKQDKIKSVTKYEQVVSFVRDTVMNTGRWVKRAEMIKALKGKVGRTTIDRKLDEAVENGDLINPEYGYYSVALNREAEIPLKE
jgi:hypothetical protein